tara:strand:- start:495 stop:659 length:165 start_codon:yes stop_codon:yes gene_type:complete
MKKYKLTDTSNQTIIYECEVMANSEEEAIEKAENWEEIESNCNHNDIEVEVVEE